MEDANEEKQLGIVSRRRAREAAVQALYQCDTLGDTSDAQLDLFFAHFFPEKPESATGAPHENYLFARALVRGVVTEISFIDDHIAQASAHWRVGRMARVDRNILRVAVFELARMDEIPVNVTIDEAIEIAKRFGAPDSPVFVNGVLDNVAKKLFKDEDGQLKKKAVSAA